LIVPDPRVRYGQVIKQCAGRRLVSVTRRVIFGVEELIPLKQISTSLLERLNGTIRRRVAPLHRKTRMSDGSRYADTAFQELLQSVPEARFIERQDAGASGGHDRSSNERSFIVVLIKLSNANKT